MAKVSVIMGVCNCASTIDAAIRAIENQTFTDWELILCDDASQDRTASIAQSWVERDGRILLLRNAENRGLGYALNRCLRRASGEYIARMDGDDDCLPERFAEEVDFLDSHPEFSFVSTAMTLFDETGDWAVLENPADPTIEDVLRGTPVFHAPAMFRRICLEAVGGYNDEQAIRRAEDVDLWIRLYAAGFRCHNLSLPLYRMRCDGEAYRRRKYRWRIHETRVRLAGCARLGMPPGFYFSAVKPLAAGLVPWRVRQIIRRSQWRGKP